MSDEYSIPDDFPLLQSVVEKQIDTLSRVYVYDILIKAQFDGNKYPKDKKLYHAPTNNAYTEGQQLTIPNEYAFQTYADMQKRMADPTFPSAGRELYAKICLDLECRRQLFRKDAYNNKKEELTKQEATNHTLRKKLQADKDFQKYVCWHYCTYENDLNAKANRNASKLIDKPLMAGYMALSENVSSVIVLPLERVYSRIWFHFQWNGLQEADRIGIDSIVVNGLQQRTQVFNIHRELVNNNPSEPLCVQSLIINKDKSHCSLPFLGDLTQKAYPYHLESNGTGSDPELYFEANNCTKYNTVCRYEDIVAPANSKPFERKPHIYYIYSFQWGGNEMKDDPEIKVYYHFRKKQSGNDPNATDSRETLIYKKATARLYDATHQPGKRHHGLLRNYTYRLNCLVSTLTNVLELQVVSVPWYQVEINDIPPFE
ncbi:hypothetical protein EVA_06388 [gut metagenome]|uniref:Uncharacterized protein n=1 Tax=gut metagenome TaxID=749906 RepID=J9GSA9_9ZZZZ